MGLTQPRSALFRHVLAVLAAQTDAAQTAAHALAHLHQHRHPQLDAAVPFERHAALALEARDATAWAARVPWDVFCDAVLPPACLDEPRDDWRAVLYPRCSALVAGTRSADEAALVLNARIWAEFGVRFEPGLSPMMLAPLTVIEHGCASCTGLSLLLTACCRSVGIPARVAGVGDWGDGSGNHVWVEVWVEVGGVGDWHSIGACEPTALDATWFAERLRGPNGARVFASTYGRTQGAACGCTFPAPWATAELPAIEVTQRYRDTAS